MEVPTPPHPPVPDRPGAPAAGPTAGEGGAPLKILFVDDEPDLAPLIRQTFRRHVRENEYGQSDNPFPRRIQAACG